MADVYVVGSVNMDVVALADRHPRHGETVRGNDLKFLPGGKGANQAVAARRAGARTYMVGTLGDDAFARELRAFLEAEGLDLSFLGVAPGVPTGTALITVAEAENTIVVVPGANDALSVTDVKDLPFAAGGVVVAEFETPQSTVLAAFQRAQQIGARTILNPAPAATPIAGLLEATDVLVVNESEVSWLVDGTSAGLMSPDDAVAAAKKARHRHEQIVIVTLGANGAVAVAGDRTLRVEGHEVDAVDTTGAGDCFVGNLAAELARGADYASALQVANQAASICVQVLGAAGSMPYQDDADHALAA